MPLMLKKNCEFVIRKSKIVNLFFNNNLFYSTMKKILILALVACSSMAYAQKGKTVKLFDGKSTNGWHTWHETTVKGWHVMDGVLMSHGGNGDLVTDKEYEDFEIE